MIAILLATSAFAIDRETVLDSAAAYTTHEWTMTSVNETATCSASYVSDYTAGTYRGVPYDWGGYYTLDEYDAAIAAGLGAGSHSWHGILDCTAGVDCSGFVSEIWETPHQSTSTFYQVSSDIGVNDLVRADAVDEVGSHMVLWAYQTGGGTPVFYEAAGSAQKARLNATSGWSYLDGFQPIRFDSIEDGPSTGTVVAPREIAAFPFEDARWTAGAASDAIDHYSCAPTTDESGPEVLYHFSVREAGLLHAVVSDDSGVDIDVHVLTAPNGDACIARDDSEVSVEVGPGDVWLALDTYVSSREFPGPFLLDATFDGVLGVPDDTGVDTNTGDTATDTSTDGALAWTRQRIGHGGCDHTGSVGWFGLIGALLVRRRR